ncbi:MAG: GFA family protein [Myxococcota bacterium]
MTDGGRAGGCLCGAVRYRALGAASSPTLCHCRTCRRAAGAPAVAWVSFPRAGFAFTGSEPVRYRSSAQVVRTFCGRCGTPLSYAHEDEPGSIDVTTASLDQPDELPPRDQLWTSHSLAWSEGLAALPRHPGKRGAPGE